MSWLPSERVRATQRMRPPSAARHLAMASPMPRLAPVTMTLCPSSLPTMSLHTEAPPDARRAGCDFESRGSYGTAGEVSRDGGSGYTGMRVRRGRSSGESSRSNLVSNVANWPPNLMAVASKRASVTCRCPWRRAIKTSGRSSIERSIGQNVCVSSVKSSASIASPSRGVAVCRTADGMQEIRTKPASVTGHVAQPCPLIGSNHSQAASWWT